MAMMTMLMMTVMMTKEMTTPAVRGVIIIEKKLVKGTVRPAAGVERLSTFT
jgi:hypothetical protein